MSSNEHLLRRYPDLIAPDSDADLIRTVGELDAAAAAARSLQPPATLEEAIDRMIREQRAAHRQSGSPASPAVAPLREQAGDAFPLHEHSPLGGIQARQTNRGWLRQSVELAAAVVAILLVAGVLVAVFRDEPDDSAGNQAPPVTSPTVPATAPITAGSPTSAVPTAATDASILAADAALTRAREVLDQIAGAGAAQARIVSVRLTYLSAIMPKANWLWIVGDAVYGDPDTPIWEIEADGLEQDSGCETSPNCWGSRVVVVLDAATGVEIGMRHPDGGITRGTPTDEIPAVPDDAQFGTIESAIQHSIDSQMGAWRGSQISHVVGIWLIRAADFPISWVEITSDDPVWLLLIDDGCSFDTCGFGDVVVIMNPTDGMVLVQGSGAAETRPDSLVLRDPLKVKVVAVTQVPGKDGQPAWVIEASMWFMTISDVWERPSDYPGLDPWVPIWRVEVADAGYEGPCPSGTGGQSTCVFDHVVMIFNAATSELLRIDGDQTPVPPATPTPGVTPSPSPPGIPVPDLPEDAALRTPYDARDSALRWADSILQGHDAEVISTSLVTVSDALTIQEQRAGSWMQVWDFTTFSVPVWIVELSGTSFHRYDCDECPTGTSALLTIRAQDDALYWAAVGSQETMNMTQIIPDLPRESFSAKDVTPEEMAQHAIEYTRDRGMIEGDEPEILFAMAATAPELQKVGLSGAAYSPTCQRPFYVVVLRGNFAEDVEYIGYVFDLARGAPGDVATQIESPTIDPFWPLLAAEPVTPPITGSPDAGTQPSEVVHCEDIWV